MQSFVKIKPLRNGKITPSFNNIGKSYPSLKFQGVENMSFNAIRENNILAKISRFTVFIVYCCFHCVCVFYVRCLLFTVVLSALEV